MYIEIDPYNPGWDEINEIAAMMRLGHVVILPTDTVYAFTGLYGNKKAMEKMADLKSVKLKKAKFSLFFKDIQSTSDYLKPLNRSQFKSLTKNTPGAHTFILPCSQKTSKQLGGGRETIGVRIPDFPLITKLLDELDQPICSTSIHDSDEIKEYPTDPSEIILQYEDTVGAVVAGGHGGVTASTIVDLTKGEPEILRDGLGDFEW